MKSIRSVFAKAAFLLALTSGTNFLTASQAQVLVKHGLANESAGNIRFISAEGDMLVFELRLVRPLPKGSMLRITDGESNVIFEERTSADTYSIRYKIVKNDMSKVIFEVSNKNFFLNQSFNINSRTEEKVEVTKA